VDIKACHDSKQHSHHLAAVTTSTTQTHRQWKQQLLIIEYGKHAAVTSWHVAQLSMPTAADKRNNSTNNASWQPSLQEAGIPRTGRCNERLQLCSKDKHQRLSGTVGHCTTCIALLLLTCSPTTPASNWCMLHVNKIVKTPWLRRLGEQHHTSSVRNKPSLSAMNAHGHVCMHMHDSGDGVTDKTLLLQRIKPEWRECWTIG
jgi:hypothetical protein